MGKFALYLLVVELKLSPFQQQDFGDLTNHVAGCNYMRTTGDSAWSVSGSNMVMDKTIFLLFFLPALNSKGCTEKMVK